MLIMKMLETYMRNSYMHFQIQHVRSFDHTKHFTLHILLHITYVSDSFAQVMKKGRKTHLFGHCFSTKPEPETVDFDAAGGYGGIIRNGQKPNTDDFFKGFERFEVNPKKLKRENRQLHLRNKKKI